MRIYIKWFKRLDKERKPAFIKLRMTFLNIWKENASHTFWPEKNLKRTPIQLRKKRETLTLILVLLLLEVIIISCPLKNLVQWKKKGFSICLLSIARTSYGLVISRTCGLREPWAQIHDAMKLEKRRRNLELGSISKENRKSNRIQGVSVQSSAKLWGFFAMGYKRDTMKP